MGRTAKIRHRRRRRDAARRAKWWAENERVALELEKLASLVVRSVTVAAPGLRATLEARDRQKGGPG